MPSPQVRRALQRPKPGVGKLPVAGITWAVGLPATRGTLAAGSTRISQTTSQAISRGFAATSTMRGGCTADPSAMISLAMGVVADVALSVLDKAASLGYGADRGGSKTQQPIFFCPMIG